MNESSDISMPGETRHASSWGIVITARATYLKPWYEGFAEAQSGNWRTLLVLPRDAPHVHPADLTTPTHPRLTIHELSSQRRTRSTGGNHSATHFGADYLWLPEQSISSVLRSANTRGIIVHEYSPFTLMALLYAKRAGLPIVGFGDVGRDNAASYSWSTRLWHSFWSLAIDAKIAGCPAARVAVSGRRLPGIDSFHAVDTSVFKPIAKKLAANGCTTFVFSGQVIARKGLDLWFEAASLLTKSGHSNFRLKILGGGDEAWGRACAEKSGVAHIVEWCGFLQRDQLREGLGSADVFVLPSRWDSYAVVTHEAASLGLPLLISQHAGSAAALVDEGVTGWQIDPFDASSFAAAMLRFMQPQLRQAMGAAAREKAIQLCARRRGAAVWQWITETFSIPSP
jgi:glycosyltransferase involved in cell wall biosynthesis